MTGISGPGRKGVAWGRDAERARPRPRGAEGAELGSEYSQLQGGEAVDGADGAVEGESADERVGSGTAPGGEGTVFDADPLVAAQDQRDEYLDSLRRLQAEFENYKKRVAKQQQDQVARAAVSLVEKVLPVMDALDLATAHLGDTESPDGRALVAVSNQLRDVLAKEGLERIDPLGEEFDPNAHEAVGHLPADEPSPADGDDPDPAPQGDPAPGEPVVAQVMRAGYRWRGTVVRPAMVTVRG
ncbi:MAG TPA: nucleotide exchange factor GrpE [Acidimicrobiales bacterium]|nr:nucleotide exchange factor GrpE [Acidimicrobiales bacterium]